MEMAKIINETNNNINNTHIINELLLILKNLETKTIVQFFDESQKEVNEIFEIISKISSNNILNQISNINSIINLEFMYLKYSLFQKNIKYLEFVQ